jgi:hypothetical protein
MSFEFDWQIGDDGDWAEQDSGEPVSPPRCPLLWRIVRQVPLWVWYMLLGTVLVAALGGFLTVWYRYRRVEERLAFQIQAVVDLQGRALAEGDVDRYMAQQDRDAAQWYELQSLLLLAILEWSDDFDPEAMPFVARPAEVRRVELYGDVAWVEVVEGDPPVRAIRFYRRSGPGWLQTRPDPAFWGDEIRLDGKDGLTVYVHQRDRPYVEPLADVLEQDLAQVCATIGCPDEVTLVIATTESERFQMDANVLSPWLSGIPVDGSPWFASPSALYPGQSVRQAVLQQVVDRATSE